MGDGGISARVISHARAASPRPRHPSGGSPQEQEGQEEDRHHVRRGGHHLHRLLGALPRLLPPGLPPPLHHSVPTHRQFISIYYC